VRERQQEALHRFLKTHTVILSDGTITSNTFRVTWKDMDMLTHALEGPKLEQLLTSIPSVKKRWRELEEADRRDAPAYDRT
jgi:hypothetical protein